MSFTKKQTKKNVLFAASQIIVSGITLFVLYKYLLNVIGVELIGVWSIVMAFSAFLRTGDFGFAGSIVKFVSVAATKNENQKIISIITTSFTSVAIALGLLLLIFYPIFYYLLSNFIDSKYIDLARELLLYSLASVWMAVLGTLLIFVFDGLNRVDIRSIFLVVLNLLLVVLTITFVHFYGFIGLGYAQLSQGIILLISSWVLLQKHITFHQLLPWGWDKKIFKEIFSYSIHLQVSSLMSMMLEPITKLMLGHFGTLSNVGYFEMANRLVMQVRNIIVNANQALVPMLSKAHTEKESMHLLFTKMFKVLFFISIIVYPLVGLLTPLISELWIGSLVENFTIYTYLILFALGVNTLSGAAYFTNMGSGDVKYNTYSQIIIAIANIIFGIVLGILDQGLGVVIAYSISIVIGSLWLILNFYRRKQNA